MSNLVEIKDSFDNTLMQTTLSKYKEFFNKHPTVGETISIDRNEFTNAKFGFDAKVIGTSIRSSPVFSMYSNSYIQIIKVEILNTYDK